MSTGAERDGRRDPTWWLLAFVIAGLLGWLGAGLPLASLRPPLVLGLVGVVAAAAIAARSPLVSGGWLGGTRSHRVALALAGAVGIAIGLATRGAYFLGDDFGYVQLFHAKSWTAVLRPGDISEGIWGHPLDEMRPFFALAFKAGTALHGTNALSWHVGNALLHGLAAVLVAALARAAGAPSPVAALAGLLFAVQPAHTETVAWITGR